MSERIFQRHGLAQIFPEMVMFAMGHDILSNTALHEDLTAAYGGSQATFGDHPQLPKFFVTAFDVMEETTAVFGNFPASEVTSSARSSDPDGYDFWGDRAEGFWGGGGGTGGESERGARLFTPRATAATRYCYGYE